MHHYGCAFVCKARALLAQLLFDAVSPLSLGLTDLLEGLGLPVRPASFDTVVASYHYTALETLLPLLADQARWMIEVNRRAIEHAGNNQKARDELMSLLTESHDRLKRLQAYAKSVAPKSITTGAP